MTDLEIASKYTLEDIRVIGKKLKLKEEDLLLYGNDKAKIIKSRGNKKGKLILVTAINPTPLGEGKTTVSIGLNDALNKIGKNAIASLREPSMGPVFGMKGGATGGGCSQIAPMVDINLHFTGDMHAITSANNLLCAAIDNHIERGNSLDINKVLFNRCLDVNDRELRNINLKNRKEQFNITAASEIMAIFCLATSLDNLRERLGNIIIGTNSKGEYIYAKELNIVGSLVTLLKDAFYPNLVQTLENNPVIVHGGPFANIAHGCSSVISTKLSLSLADYVVTEAGFGADLGAEKFFDIKCRNNIKPDCIVLVATIKALKYHGEGSLEKGITNLKIHIENILRNNSNLVVCLNKYEADLEQDIKYVEDFCTGLGVLFSISTAYKDGGAGAIPLAEKVLTSLEKENKFEFLYENNLTIKEKIEIISKKIYRAKDVEYTKEALDKIEALKEFANLPVCIAKTQYSLSDNKDNLLLEGDYNITVRDIRINGGAGFITVLLGNILTMPGLPKEPNYELIDIIDDKVVGIF